MKKWAIVGVLAALVVSVLLIGKYQDQKYPIQPDQSNLLEEVTWWVNRGYDQPVLEDIALHDYVELGEYRYVLIDVEDQLGMAYLEQGPNGNYRMAGSSYGGGNFHFEELEHDGVRFVLIGGKNEYFGIDSIEFEMDDRVYRAELPPGDRFLTKIEIHPPLDPDAPLRHVELDTIRFCDEAGQDITSQVPWNGMRPWDGTPSVNQK
ncbi:MAG: hypothetical protein IKB65_07835 [Ruminiclostridium sp.]|nr:hypothetical protein [Ruminiclostridium sp.]